MARSFDEIQAPGKGRSKGCPRCGAEKNAGMITVAAQRLSPKGSLSTGGGRVASRSISLCESCCVEVFEKLAADVEGLKNAA